MAPGRDRRGGRAPRGAPQDAGGRGDNGSARGRGAGRGGRGRGRGRGGIRKDNDGDVKMDAVPDTHRRGGGISKNTKPAPRGRGRGFKADTERLERAVRGDDDARHARNIKSQIRISNEASGRAPTSGQKLDTLLVRVERKPNGTRDEPDEANLIGFLERKASGKGKKIRLQNYTSTIDGLRIRVSPIDTPSFKRIDGFDYGDSFTVQVELEKKGTEMSEEAQALRKLFRDLLARRYNVETKTLDLSCLRQDPAFAPENFSEQAANDLFQGEKLFAALFDQATRNPETDQEMTGAQKRDAFVNVSLAQNGFLGLRQIKDLSTYFPQLQGLDLSNNQIGDVEAFQAWRRKLKALRLLYVSNNPFTLSPVYQNWQEELVKWFPALVTLNDVQVRSEAEAAANSSLQTVDYRVQGPYISDTTGEVVQFVRNFVNGFDNDRHGLLEAYYDDKSTFAISDTIKDRTKPDPYVKRSRNLLKVTTPTTRIDRLYTGQQNIFNVWSSIPPTRHPDLDQEANQWCIESQLMPGADGPNRGPIGQNGHTINIHSKFIEIDSTQSAPSIRSFDRNIVVGPGSGPGGMRVISDLLTVRDESDPSAWLPTPVAPPPVAPVQPAPPAIMAPAEAQAQPEVATPAMLVQQFQEVTGLTAEYAKMCLETVDWVPEAAMARYNEVRSGLPAEAYLLVK